MPDLIDSAGIVWFLSLAFGAPLLGWLCMVIDYRAYLRSLKRAIAIVRRYATDLPQWARHDRIPCFDELDLPANATREEVLAAYRSRVKEVHPDRGGDRKQFDRLQRRFEEAMTVVEDRLETPS